jgi:hypothetical protein
LWCSSFKIWKKLVSLPKNHFFLQILMFYTISLLWLIAS